MLVFLPIYIYYHNSLCCSVKETRIHLRAMDQITHSRNEGIVSKRTTTLRERWQWFGWVLLLLAVFTWFFHECIFQGYTLIPTDVLHQLILPYSASVLHPVVQNHFTLDTLQQDCPWGELWKKSFFAGEMPLWNPAVYGGIPNMATSMAAVFSPFKLLLLWLNVERAASFGIVLQFTLAGLFMFAFLRELGRSPCACFVGSCAFAFNTNLLMWYWREAAVFAWVPLVLLLFERSTRRESWTSTIACGLVLGVAFLGGNVQSAVHVAFLCSLYWMLTVPWGEVSRRNIAIMRIAAALFIGICVAAVQWLPTLELMRNDVTGRVQSAGPRPGIYQTVLGIPFCITFVFNGLMGSTETYDLTKLIHATMQDFTGYVGVIPFTMFLIGAVDFREKRVRVWLIIAALVLVILFFTPLVSYLYHRFFIVSVFSTTVVAAYGTDFVLDKSREHPARVRSVLSWMTAAVIILGLGLISAQIFVHMKRMALLEAGQQYVMSHTESTFFGGNQQWLRDRLPLFLDHYRISNILFWLPISSLIAFTIVCRAFLQGKIGRSALCVALAVLTVCDLTVAGRRIVPEVNLQEYPLYPPLPVLARAQDDPDLFRVQRWPLAKPKFLPNNMLMAYGLSTASGYESLAPANLNSFLGGTNDEDNVLLDLANVKYLLAQHEVELPPENFELVADSPTLRLYRNKHCLPRAQFILNWQVVPDHRRVLSLMQSPTFYPDKMVFLEKDPPSGFTMTATATASPPATVWVEHYDNQRVALHVRSAQPGALLLGDVFYPGWKARLDGHETEVYRADSVLRAVFVPAGGHEIEFVYDPLSYRVGATLTVSTIAIAVVWMLARLLLFRSPVRKRSFPVR
jgi:membrane protein YfhO